VLEDAQGFIATQSDADPSADKPLPRPGSLVVGTLFKYHAACYLTHSSIEAIKLLRTQLSFNGPDVASIDLHVAPGHLSVCNIPSPRSGLETKFSLRHTAALAACGKDTAAIQTYSDENARNATLTTVRERVTVHGDRTAGRDAQVMIRTSGGQTAEATFDVAIPDRDLGRQGARLAAKFHSLADPVIGAERAGALQRNIASLDADHDIHLLMAA
jgi:2-methylcitrate dehydratase PrpD